MKQIRIKIIDTQNNDVVQVITPNSDFQVPGLNQEIENFTQKSAPQLVYEGSDDKYQALMTSSFVFDMLVTDGADGKFYHLFTGSESRFRVDIVGELNKLIWRGFLLPDQYSEPYKSPTFFVSMTATDRLGLLRGQYLEQSYYNEERSIIDFITACLQKTGLKQDLLFAPSIISSVGLRWDEIYVNGKLYIDEPEEGLAMLWTRREKDSCYEILERLVSDLGCTLFTYGGKWYLIGINQKHKEIKQFHKYNYKGINQGVEVVPVEIKKPVFVADPLITIQSPWKRVEISADKNENKELIDEFYYRHEESVFSPYRNPSRFWSPQNTTMSYNPENGKWLYTWTHFNQVIPDVTEIYPFVLAVSGFKIENNVKGSYIELKDKIYVSKSSELFQYYSFEMELSAYSRLVTKERFENNEFGDMFRYELLLNNEVILSSFPDSPKYAAGGLELRYSDSGIEYKEGVHYNKNFIEARKKITAKIQQPSIGLSASGFLNVRIYPVVLKNNFEVTFDRVGIDKLSLKLKGKDSYFLNKERTIDYTTSREVDLFHLDNAQDNTFKKFVFRHPSIPVENKSWREAWRRADIAETIRFADAHARMVHDVQPKPHVKIDGRTIGIYNPTQLMKFHWREEKTFIPTRITLDFSEGRTDITMIEAVIENVQDYGYS